MDKEFNRKFSEEVNNFRNRLVTCAKKSEWGNFKIVAGKLFDYVESIEMVAIERQFFRISKYILGALAIYVLFILKMNYAVDPEILKFRDSAIILGIAVCGFQFFFYVNFRIYRQGKVMFYESRRQQFIRNIETDFRDFATVPENNTFLSGEEDKRR